MLMVEAPGEPASGVSFRDSLKQAELLVGTVVTSIDPLIAEAVAGSRLDFVMIDGEHGGLDAQSITSGILATNVYGMRSIVRLAGDDPVQFMQPLDAGADGIVVPRIKTASDVRRAIDLARYPPEGSRGYGPRRAGRYGRNEETYVAQANQEIAVIVQIETREAVDNLDEILSVAGLDGILVGRNDLSGSLGLPRDHKDPQLLRVSADILARARQRGLARGIAAGTDFRSVTELEEMGANLVLAGGDFGFLVKGLDDYLVHVEAYRRDRRAGQRTLEAERTTKLWNVGGKVTSLSREQEFLVSVGANIRGIEQLTVDGAKGEVLFAELGGTRILAFETVGYEEVLGRQLGLGWSHIVFEVDDLEAAMRQFASAGASLLQGPSIVEASFTRRRIAFFESPGGCIYEVFVELSRSVGDAEH
jgi:2-keto-3-deoxy-L-rhamnonate aldolase RhmA